MTSDRIIAANRANARKSTGPNTAAGKSRSRRNAYRHGLAVAISSQSGFSEKIDRLAASLCEQREVTEFARAIVEAELDLRRIREMRVSQFSAIIGSSDAPLAAYAKLTENLRVLERYEQRAYARRKRALKALIRCS